MNQCCWKKILHEPTLDEGLLSDVYDWIMRLLMGHEIEIEEEAYTLSASEPDAIKSVIVKAAETLGMTAEELDAAPPLCYAGFLKEDVDVVNYTGRTIGKVFYVIAAIVWVIGTGTIVTAAIAPGLKLLLGAVWGYLGYKTLI